MRLTVTATVFVLATAIVAMAADADLRLVTAAADQDRAAVRLLLKQGVSVNTSRPDGATALLFAAHWDDLETVDLLLKSGARVNAADDHGVTPLARATENASTSMVERLLKAGADPNLAQMSGMTPLMIASHTGNLEVVKSLLARGANVNAETVETKSTALMWAVAAPHPDIAKVLVEGRADVHASSNKGFTPLMFAAKNGDIEMAKLLIAAGVNVNEKGSDGTHALPYSIVSGQGDFAKFLLDQGADANADMDGVRALHAAAGVVDTWLNEWYRRHGSSGASGFGFSSGQRLNPAMRNDLVKMLVAKGADVNARIDASGMLMSYIGYPKKGAFEPFACGTGDLRGATALWVAAYTANGGVRGGEGRQDVDPLRAGASVDVIRTLLAAGADQKIASVDGTTPFMMAAGLGRSTFTPGRPRADRSVAAEEAVKVLFEAGAEINRVNEADFTALHGAAMRGLNEVIKYLVDNGADINARDFRGRTAYRLAEGSKQSFQFQAWPETAEYIKSLGANTRLGLAGTVQERLRDIGAGQQE